MLELASEQLGELEAEREGEHAHLAELRGGGRLTTQAQLDAAQAELREAGQEAEAARGKLDQVCAVWVTRRGGKASSPPPKPYGLI